MKIENKWTRIIFDKEQKCIPHLDFCVGNFSLIPKNLDFLSFGPSRENKNKMVSTPIPCKQVETALLRFTRFEWIIHKYIHVFINIKEQVPTPTWLDEENLCSFDKPKIDPNLFINWKTKERHWSSTNLLSPLPLKFVCVGYLSPFFRFLSFYLGNNNILLVIFYYIF